MGRKGAISTKSTAAHRRGVLTTEHELAAFWSRMLWAHPDVIRLQVCISYPKPVATGIDSDGDEYDIYPNPAHGVWTTLDSRQLGEQVPWPGGVPWPLPPFCNRSMLGMYPRSGVVSGLAVSSPVKVSLAIDQRPPPTRVVAVAFMVRPAKSGSGGSAYVRLRLRRLPVANKLRVRTTPSRTCPAHVHLCLCPFAFPPYAPFPLIPRSVSSSSASWPSSYFSDGEGQHLESGADCDFDF